MNGNLRRACLVLVIGVLAAFLIACGDHDKAAPQPKFSSSSAAPSGSAYSTSEPSSTINAETAEEFVRRWNDLNTQMQNTGNSAEYRAASENCEPCNSVADQVDGYYASGGSVKGGAWHFRQLDCRTVQSTGAQCTGLIDYDETRVVKAAGDQPETLAKGQFTILFYLSRARAGSWNMDNLQQQAT